MLPLFTYGGIGSDGVATNSGLPEHLSVIDVNGRTVVIRRYAPTADHVESLEGVMQTIEFDE